MRLGSLVIVLAACSSSAAAGPAWPRSTPHDTDGGESLAPRAVARSVTARDPGDKSAERPPADRPAGVSISPPVPTDRPAVTAPPPPASDEPVTTEDIVIEIED